MIACERGEAAAVDAVGAGSSDYGVTIGSADAPHTLVIYEDSAGEVAVAVNGGSAAALLGLRAGDELELS